MLLFPFQRGGLLLIFYFEPLKFSVVKSGRKIEQGKGDRQQDSILYRGNDKESEGTILWSYLRKGLPEHRKAGASIPRQELAWYVQGISK